MTGKVYLVGAGPGDPELLTLKALRILQSADVVLHDDLVSPEILAFAPSSAEIRNVGKRGGKRSTRQEEINELLVNYALLDLQVVRLKGGDPLVFGRAGEEIEALRKAGVAFEIVPGVTSALGAAASSQIPLTHRDISSALLVLTGHQSLSSSSSSDRPAPSARNHDWPERIPEATTVLVYMPGYEYQSTSQHLMAAGVKGNTPCAVISHATCFDEQIHHTTVAELYLTPRLPSPTLLVVGDVVRLGRQASQHAETSIAERGQSDALALFPEFLAALEFSAHQEQSK